MREITFTLFVVGLCSMSVAQVSQVSLLRESSTFLFSEEEPEIWSQGRVRMARPLASLVQATEEKTENVPLQTDKENEDPKKGDPKAKDSSVSESSMSQEGSKDPSDRQQPKPQWFSKRIVELSLKQASDQGKLPKDVSGELLSEFGTPTLDRCEWLDQAYLWTAPEICYRPLLFEDACLERYGQHHGCCQTAFSAIHFFSRAALFPYRRAAYLCDDCECNLGYSRPSPRLQIPQACPAGR
jgi:hypothetical protein